MAECKKYPLSIKRFVTFRIPVYSCNFRCMYCYVGLHQDAYKGGIKPFCESPEYIANYFSPERMGGYCYFNLCADGETTLHPQWVELVSRLTAEGHFVDTITNGSMSNRFDEIIAALSPEQRKRFFIKFSFHYLELKKENLLEKYVENVNKIKDAGISYSVYNKPRNRTAG